MKLPQPAIEDLFEDIVGKAARGLGMTLPSPLPKDEKAVCELARKLQLNPDALWESASGAYAPEPVGELDGLAMFVTAYGDMLVNSYLVHDPSQPDAPAAIFDTGADCSEMLALNLPVENVFLTHIHADHIFDLDRLVEKTRAKAWVSRRDPIGGGTPFADGAVFSIGSLRVEARRTSGHAPGGVTYVITGLQRPLAIVGDAIFAGSMGGTKSPQAYQEALSTNRESIFSLPAEAILCPGHGPLTTVGEERTHNPFFA